MSNIIVYSKDYCPYCTRAKELLKLLDQEFTEIDITNDDAGKAQMVEKANGATTVPQIFIGDEHIGGFDDMYALHQAGDLVPKFK